MLNPGAKVLIVPSYVGGDCVTYRRGIVVQVLKDETVVVQPVSGFNVHYAASRIVKPTRYYTTVDFRPSEIHPENPPPFSS